MAFCSTLLFTADPDGRGRGGTLPLVLYQVGCGFVLNHLWLTNLADLDWALTRPDPWGKFPGWFNVVPVGSSVRGENRMRMCARVAAAVLSAGLATSSYGAAISVNFTGGQPAETGGFTLAPMDQAGNPNV